MRSCCRSVACHSRRWRWRSATGRGRTHPPRHRQLLSRDPGGAPSCCRSRSQPGRPPHGPSSSHSSSSATPSSSSPGSSASRDHGRVVARSGRRLRGAFPPGLPGVPSAVSRGAAPDMSRCVLGAVRDLRPVVRAVGRWAVWRGRRLVVDGGRQSDTGTARRVFVAGVRWSRTGRGEVAAHRAIARAGRPTGRTPGAERDGLGGRALWRPPKGSRRAHARWRVATFSGFPRRCSERLRSQRRRCARDAIWRTWAGVPVGGCGA
jgi:hypothetical protein